MSKPLTCVVCGKIFYSQSANHAGKYCSDECRKAAAREKYHELHKSTKGEIATCPICGTQFRKTRDTHTFCSQRCCNENNRRRTVQAHARERAKRAEYLANMVAEEKNLKKISRAVSPEPKVKHTISEIVAKARERHMSYGKFLERYGDDW